MDFLKKHLTPNISSTILGFCGLFFQNSAYAAVYQILSDYFYQNPAELSQIHETQLILGNIFAIPSMKFNGQTPFFDSRNRYTADERNLSPSYVLIRWFYS